MWKTSLGKARIGSFYSCRNLAVCKLGKKSNFKFRVALKIYFHRDLNKLVRIVVPSAIYFCEICFTTKSINFS